ncbi:MAG: hypothetical protein ACLTQI_06000 [Slackia sp.]
MVNEDKSVEDETLGHLDLGVIIGELRATTSWDGILSMRRPREVDGRGLCRHCHPKIQHKDNYSFGRFPASQIEYYVNEKLGQLRPR